VFSWYPNAVLESDIYVVAGPVAEARPVIYQLHDANSKPSAFPPWGVFEVPQSGQTVSGSTVEVGGWTFGTSQVMSLDVFLDGVAVGTATYGSPRPDIPKAYPGIPDTNSGFQYTLDSTKYTSGRHDLVVKATDAIGNLAVFPTAHITISNP
jgi:Bacterial Ig domain